ncbi:MAG: NAD-dependent epimerase/dehydratase family protein [Bacillota bacterium]
MARILVTGSRGTLSSRLIELLENQGHEVWGLDLQHYHHDRYLRADISQFRQLERVFDQPYDFVYHLAAEFGRINGEEYYDTLWQTNVVGTRNILEWQLRKGFKLIFTSSSEIYGETSEPVLREDLPLTKPIIQHNDYALSKWVNEVQIINFMKRHDSPVVRLRLFNAYGPGEYYHPYRSVVCLFVYRALHKQPYQVFKGYYRVFMYIDDLITTMANVVKVFKEGEVYNIGGTDYRSVQELSDLVLEYTCADPGLAEYLPEDKHNTVSKRPDISKAVSDLNHKPLVLLEQGLPKTIAWMKNAYGEQ